MNESLAIVMPVFNESGTIEYVIDDWCTCLNSLNIDYTFFIYNDGSTDDTSKIITNIKDKYKRIVYIDKNNEGHGPTILRGYRDVSCLANKNFTWIFQIDSDNELSSLQFPCLWEKHSQYDFLLGRRSCREQNIARKIISFISRATVFFLYGKAVFDVNSPYRLMRISKFKKVFFSIPDKTFAPNVIISGYAAYSKMRCYEINVQYSARSTGSVSLKKFKLLKCAAVSFIQTVIFRLHIYNI